MISFKKYIILESVPDLSDNTKAVFDEMLNRGLYKKYKFVWVVSDKSKPLPSYPNTIYIDKKTRINKKLLSWYKFRAKCLICCNRFYGTKYSGQSSFYLTHGTGIKKIGDYNVPHNVDYVLIGAEHMKAIMASELRGDINKFFALGLPRNDVFSSEPIDLHGLFNNNFSKIICWYPTFRQHKGGSKTASSNALPIIHNEKQAMLLNEFAKQKNILIIVKPHFAQDTSYINTKQMSNMLFIDDTFFESNKITSYEFISSCDALITDYSSVYFDYLLSDRPVAAVWEDIEDYRKNPGFAIDVDYYMKAAHKIYTVSDFEDFISQVASGEDRYKEERLEINKLVNYSNDGNNTKRVVDFIIDKAGL